MATRTEPGFWLPILIIAGLSLVASTAVLAMTSAAGFGYLRTHWCGNGKIEYRETCDDGNRRNGDGCSSQCRKETTVKRCEDGHVIGERFKSPDGCNTCTCTTGGIACTEMACAPRSSSSRSSTAAGQKCLSSEQCPKDQYCTTEDGDCQSACEPGAMVCIQACAGVCRSVQCKPYVCPDGTRHPSCSEDGHVINYFADPCLTHQSSSSTARCGDGICQEGEATSCPACRNSSPPCMAPCYAGTCPKDCPVQ